MRSVYFRVRLLNKRNGEEKSEAQLDRNGDGGTCGRSVKLATSNQLLVTGYLKKKSWLLVTSYLNQEKLATSSQLLVAKLLKVRKVGY